MQFEACEKLLVVMNKRMYAIWAPSAARAQAQNMHFAAFGTNKRNPRLEIGNSATGLVVPDASPCRPSTKHTHRETFFSVLNPSTGY